MVYDDVGGVGYDDEEDADGVTSAFGADSFDARIVVLDWLSRPNARGPDLQLGLGVHDCYRPRQPQLPQFRVGLLRIDKGHRLDGHSGVSGARRTGRNGAQRVVSWPVVLR